MSARVFILQLISTGSNASFSGSVSEPLLRTAVTFLDGDRTDRTSEVDVEYYLPSVAAMPASGGRSYTSSPASFPVIATFTDLGEQILAGDYGAWTFSITAIYEHDFPAGTSVESVYFASASHTPCALDPAIHISVSGGDQLGPNQTYTGTATVTVPSGVPPYTYLWYLGTGTQTSSGMVTTTPTTTGTITGGQGTDTITFQDVTGPADNPHITVVTCIVIDSHTPLPCTGTESIIWDIRRQTGGGPAANPLSIGAIAVDSPRQWLHVALGTINVVSTFHAGDGSPAFTSPAYAVDKFLAFRTDPRRATLLMLGVSGGSAPLFLSRDGGLSATQVLSVTTKNALLEILSEKGIVLLMSTDASAATTAGNVSYLQSLDGGVTWGAPALAKYKGSTLVAALADISYDPRRSALQMLCTTGSGTSASTIVLQSIDVGETWTLKLS